MSLVRQYLENYVQHLAQIGHFALLEKYVLKHGKDAIPVIGAHARRFPRGEQGLCYMNATILVQRVPDLTYCEGFALKPSLRLAIQHAWCVNREGEAIDTTWGQDELDISYLGVPIKTSEVVAECSRTGVYGILDTGRGLNLDFIQRTDPALVEEAENTWENRHTPLIAQK